MEIYRTENLTKVYGKTEETRVYALNKVNFTIEKGEFVAVMGRSGSGKSTLLHMLGAVDFPTDGDVFFCEKSLYHLKDKEQTILRRKEDKALTEEILYKLGLQEREKFYPFQLSGGQQQRTAIGRALITKPMVILADEPTGNLDAVSGEEVLALLKRLAREYNQTLVVVTHDMHVAQMADRIVKIENGRM